MLLLEARVPSRCTLPSTAPLSILDINPCRLHHLCCLTMNTWSQAVLTSHIYPKTARCQTLMEICSPQTTYPFRYQPLPELFLSIHSYMVIQIHYYGRSGYYFPNNSHTSNNKDPTQISPPICCAKQYC